MDEKMVTFTLSCSASAVCRALAVFVSWSFGVFEIVPCVLRGCRISVASLLPCCCCCGCEGKATAKEKEGFERCSFLFFFFFFFGAGFLCEERRVEWWRHLPAHSRSVRRAIRLCIWWSSWQQTVSFTTSLASDATIARAHLRSVFRFHICLPFLFLLPL